MNFVLIPEGAPCIRCGAPVMEGDANVQQIGPDVFVVLHDHCGSLSRKEITTHMCRHMARWN